MKVKEEFGSLSKKDLYSYYSAIIDLSKEYREISKDEMFEAILDMYKNISGAIPGFCTKKEWKFLQYALGHPRLTSQDKKKYKWEIDTLNRKLIFSKIDYRIFEDIHDEVKKALKKYDAPYSNSYIPYAIGLLKTRVFMPFREFKKILCDKYDLDDEEGEYFRYNPLIHFYCVLFTFHHLGEEEFIAYRDSFDDSFDNFLDAKRALGEVEPYLCEDDDYFNIFYYDFPIGDNRVRRMVKEVEKSSRAKEIFKKIKKAVIFDDKRFLRLNAQDSGLRYTIEEAMFMIPSAILNGRPACMWDGETRPSKYDFRDEPIEEGHLSEDEVQEFYKLFFSLLEYVNDKHQISAGLKMTSLKSDYNNYTWNDVIEYLFSNLEEIDEFVEENTRDFTKEELDKVKEFKRAVSSNLLFFVGHDEKYAHIYSLDGKMYMVKGLISDIHEIVEGKVPVRLVAHLVMFNGYIVYAGFLKRYTVSEEDLVNMVKEEMDDAQVCYEL